VAGHYVGIMGASHDGNIPEPDLDPTGQGRVCDFSPPGPPSCNFGGYAASNGMFYPHSAVVTKHITDGTSKTLMIAEQSDWGFRPPGVCDSGTVDIRSSRRTGIWVGFHWWVEEQIQNCDPSNPQEGGTSTTVRWLINTKTRLSWDDGIAKYGFNEPIQSAHPSGALGVYADGSVHFMEEDIDMEVLRWLCIRDDGMMH